MARTATVVAGVVWQGFGKARGGRSCENSGGIGYGSLWFFSKKMGAGPLKREAKGFCMVHGFVTWEDEMKGLEHGRK